MMTSKKFIQVCKKYAKGNYKWLHPDNLKAITPFYQNFKKFCIDNLCNEDDEDSIYDWLSQNEHNPNLMINDPNSRLIGYDPRDGHKILVLGKYKDLIFPKTQIKRGNEKELILEINEELKKEGEYDVSFHEGGNHLEFKDKKGNDLYVIEWHFDPNYKEENIVKKVCAELGITQRELAEIIKVNSGTPAQWVTKGEVPPTYQYLLELMIENKNLKEKIAKLTAFKELLDEI